MTVRDLIHLIPLLCGRESAELTASVRLPFALDLRNIAASPLR
jgi:hypothetical protein